MNNGEYEINEEELSLAQKFELPHYDKLKTDFFSRLSPEDIANLQYTGEFQLRPKQNININSDEKIHLILAGRGFGKTYTLAFWVKRIAEDAIRNKKSVNIGLVGDVYNEIVQTIIEQIINLYPEDDNKKPVYYASKQILKWNKNVIATVIVSEPNKFRGKNLTHCAIDELAKYRYRDEVWRQIKTSTRLEPAKILIATTALPKANQLLKEIRDGVHGSCKTISGSSYENIELPQDYRDNTLGTFTGKYRLQEVFGQMIEEQEGDLFKIEHLQYYNKIQEEEKSTNESFDLNRIQYLRQYLRQVVIAVDPATTSKLKSNETGIIVVGKDYIGRYLVLEDQSGKYSPNEWANKVDKLYRKYKDFIYLTSVVAETNQGGDMVVQTIHSINPSIPVNKVHASIGKVARAEPIAAYYEALKVYHIGTGLDTLENQMLSFDGEPIKEKKDDFGDLISTSPDRVDALVWGLTHIMNIKHPGRGSTNIKIRTF